MWPFGSRKHKTLSHAVLAGDIRAVRRMLDQGADPNKCDPDDDAFPIHYALNHGPEMVQLLVDHGADVNIPSQRNGAMPLAFAEAHGYGEVASILRKARGRLRTGNEELSMDPRFRLQIEPKISELVLMAHINFPTDNPETIAELVEGKLNLEFPKNMPPHDQERIWKEVRALIRKECGVKDYLRGIEKPVPSPEDVMRTYGMSEDELTRRFLEHLIEEGKNPFVDLPERFIMETEQKYPDLLALARDKFPRPEAAHSKKSPRTPQVPRTWDNLPSMAMVPVPEPFSFQTLTAYVSEEASDKQLVCIVVWGWTASQEEAFRHIQELYRFADDPSLVLMRFTAPVPGNEQLIVRASFMRDIAPHVTATRLRDLIDELSLLARERGFHTTTVQR
jgi:hypothetical protein